MEADRIGVPTYYTRVERWECDYNDHWNVRFYGRSFQLAAETAATLSGAPNPGANVMQQRHLRFHRELRVSAPVEVRSAAIAGPGELSGAVVHLLTSAGQLAATALDFPGNAGNLPVVTPSEISMAMPRGIDGSPNVERQGSGAVTDIMLGPVRSEEIDHAGHLRFEHLLRHSSTMQHTQFNALGLTPEYSDRARVNRMGVEFRVTRGASPPVGSVLHGRTWITKISGKAIWACNKILTANAQTVAAIKMCVVMVDLDTRKAVLVPDFMHRALEGRGQHNAT